MYVHVPPLVSNLYHLVLHCVVNCVKMVKEFAISLLCIHSFCQAPFSSQKLLSGDTQGTQQETWLQGRLAIR